MRATVPPPLFGYNSTVRRHGHSFHVQTEDSGLSHPHVITHVFAEGGRIVATRRTSYAEHTSSPDCAAHVRRLLVSQHRDAFIALHEGLYDSDDDPHAGDSGFDLALAPVEASPAANAANDPGERRLPAPPLDLLGMDPSAETLDDIMIRDLWGMFGES